MQLIIFGSEIVPRDLARIARTGGIDDDALVFVQDARDLPAVEGLGFETTCVEEVFPRGAENAEFGRLAVDIFGKLLSYAHGCKDSRLFEYRGLSLFHLARMNIDFGILYHAIGDLALLIRLLSRPDISSVAVLTANDALSALLEQVIAKTGFAGDVVTHAINDTKLNWKRRLVARIDRAVSVGTVAFIVRVMLGRFRSQQGSRVRESSRAYALFPLDNKHLHYETLFPILAASHDEGIAIGVSAEPSVPAQRLLAGDADLYDGYVGVTWRDWGGIYLRMLKVRRAWKKRAQEPELHALFDCLGCSLWPAVAPRLDHVVRSLFPIAMALTAQVNRIIKTRKPRVVVAAEENQLLSRVCLSAARRHEISALIVQSALIDDHPVDCHLDAAEKIAVLDDFSRGIYIGTGGASPKHVVVTGAPRWDEVVRVVRGAAGKDVREQLGLSPEEKLVVFATMPIAFSDMSRMVRAVARTVAKNSGYRCIVKIHPREEAEPYETVLSDALSGQSPPIVVKQIDFYALLSTCDLLVTSFSNVAMEAAIAEKPVLTINLTGLPDVIPFADEGLALGAYSEAEIEESLGRLLCDPATRDGLAETRRQYFERNPQVRDGRAAERVLDLLREMVADNPGPEQ